MSDDTLIKTLDCLGTLAKWFILQVIPYFLMPYWWNHEYGVGTITLMFMYTSFYAAYWMFIPKNMRIKWLLLPYISLVKKGLIGHDDYSFAVFRK